MSQRPTYHFIKNGQEVQNDVFIENLERTVLIGGIAEKEIASCLNTRYFQWRDDAPHLNVLFESDNEWEEGEDKYNTLVEVESVDMDSRFYNKCFTAARVVVDYCELNSITIIIGWN